MRQHDISKAAAVLGRKGGLTKTPARIEAARKASKASPHTGRPRKTLWWAIARIDGKDGGVICCDLTKEGCRAKAHAKTRLSFVVRRDTATPEQIAALKAVGKV